MRIDVGRSNQTGLPLNGSPFSEKNGRKFQMQVVRINDEVRGWWLVRKSKRNWLTVERFSVHRINPVLPERGSVLCSWLNQKTRDSEWSSDDAERRVSITGSGVS